MADRLAASMGRLGTETAFEVLARAKALEATGRRVIHLEIGEPDFTTPAHIVEAGMRALRDGHTHYCPAPGLPELREACAAHLSAHRGLDIDPGRVVGGAGRKALPVLRRAGDLRPGRRGHLSQPRLPDLRVGDPLRRCDAGAAAAGRGARVRVHRRRPGRAADAAHAARDPELARESHRRHRRLGADGRDRRRARRPRLLDPHRRGLLRDALRRAARHRRRPQRPARPHPARGRVLQDVRHDRLAAGLRGPADRPGGADHAASDQLGVVHGAGGAARRAWRRCRGRAPRWTRCWPSSTCAAAPWWPG